MKLHLLAVMHSLLLLSEYLVQHLQHAEMSIEEGKGTYSHMTKTCSAPASSFRLGQQ